MKIKKIIKSNEKNVHNLDDISFIVSTSKLREKPIFSGNDQKKSYKGRW